MNIVDMFKNEIFVSATETTRKNMEYIVKELVNDFPTNNLQSFSFHEDAYGTIELTLENDDIDMYIDVQNGIVRYTFWTNVSQKREIGVDSFDNINGIIEKFRGML